MLNVQLFRPGLARVHGYPQRLTDKQAIAYAMRLNDPIYSIDGFLRTIVARVKIMHAAPPVERLPANHVEEDMPL